MRRTLEELFHRKCAYCENHLAETGWNVEHFRPKKRVAESKTHPGYYWLTYEWKNLYPSCVPCNQRRKDKPTWDDPTTGQAAGKLDQFPLIDETKHAMTPADDLTLEQPLLLNPCLDNPATEFRFNPKDHIIIARQSKRLKETVRICHLQRRRIPVEREKVILCAIAYGLTISSLTQKILAGATDLQILLDELHHLRQMNLLNDECVFSAAAQDVVNDPTRFGVPEAVTKAT